MNNAHDIQVKGYVLRLNRSSFFSHVLTGAKLYRQHNLFSSMKLRFLGLEH
jgi:hypothetical protein